METTDFEAWAAEQRKTLGTDAKPAPAPLPSAEDAVARWKRQADEATEQRAIARAELRARAFRMQRRAHAAAANNNGDGVDWAALLTTLAETLNTINQRLTALETRAGINSSELTTELLDLPRFLAPRYGPGAGWPLEAGVRFSQPLMTKRKANK